MVSKLKEIEQPTRKKLWWLLFLVPIVYVVVDNLIYPIDESALLKRTTIVELEDESMDEDYPSTPSTPRIEPESKNGNGWAIYDKIWMRIDKAWPLVMSIVAFFWRKKLVGDR